MPGFGEKRAPWWPIAVWFVLMVCLIAVCHGCAHESHSVAEVKQDTTQKLNVESVTTAPTERTIKTWHFSITPGIGRALPAGGKAEPYQPWNVNAPGFDAFKGQGYAVDEYSEVTEKLAPVATTKITAVTQTSFWSKATAWAKTTTAIPVFRIAVGLAFLLVIVGYCVIRFILPRRT